MSRDNETLDFSINRAQLVRDCVNSGRSLIDIAEENGVSVEDLQRWVAEAVQTNTIDLNLNAEQTIDLGLPSDETHTEQDHSPNSGDHPLHDFGAVLGEGGMGRVIEATQSRLLRRVAVKQLRSEYGHTALTRRLVQEAFITGMLEHPNIIPIYDILDVHTNNPQIVMKKIEGEEWSTRLEQTRTFEERLERRWLEEQLTLLCRVCDAVAYAHSRGIIHRDLKPDNVMIGAFGAVYVLDWGIAVSIQDDGLANIPKAKSERGVAGTPMYMAPEMANGDGNFLSPQSDVYLLGGILHTILTGEWLREPNVSSEGIQAIVDFEYRPPDHVPERLTEILVKALAREPSERHSSVLAFQAEVEEYRDRLEIYEIMSQLRRDLAGLHDDLRAGEVERDELYPKLAVLRFQYGQVCRQLGASNPIRERYMSVIEALVRHELAECNVNVAKTLYHEHNIDNEPLLAEIVAAEAIEEKSKEDFKKLQDLSNHNLGIRTRVAVTTFGFALFLLIPILRIFGIEMNALDVTMVSLGEFIVMLGIGYWARESLFRTRINRLHFAFLLSLFLILAVVGCIALFVDGADLYLLRQTATVSLFIFYTTVIDIRLWPTSLFLFFALIAGYVLPDFYYSLLIVSHLIVIFNLYVMWKSNIKNQEDARIA